MSHERATIHLAPHFHYDPVWIEDQRTYTRQAFELVQWGSVSGWGNGQIVHTGSDPLIPLIDQHHGDVIANGVFPAAIGLLADEPGILHQLQQPLFFTHTRRASQDFEKIVADHGHLLWISILP